MRMGMVVCDSVVTLSERDGGRDGMRRLHTTKQREKQRQHYLFSISALFVLCGIVMDETVMG